MTEVIPIDFDNNRIMLSESSQNLITCDWWHFNDTIIHFCTIKHRNDVGWIGEIKVIQHYAEVD